MLLRLLVSYDGQTKPIELIGGNGFSNEHAAVREEIGGMKMSFHWGCSARGAALLPTLATI